MITMVGTPSATLSNVAVPVIAVVVIVIVIVIAPISIVIPIRVVLPVVLIVDVVVITVVTISIASCLVIGVRLLERCWGGWLGSMIRRWRHRVRHERYLGTSWTAHVRNLRVHLVEIYR